MNTFGVDFTSRPRKAKPITCAACRLDGSTLTYGGMQRLTSFEAFEAFLQSAGPWVAGMDFPFGQSRRFIDNIGWPTDWAGYVRHVSAMDRTEFRRQLDAYRQSRPAGDKEHKRHSDTVTGASSPQKIYMVPVGLMFFAGAKRLLSAGVTVAGLADGDAQRTVFEAYPGVLARRATRASYKAEARQKQTAARAEARRTIVDYVTGPELRDIYGLELVLGQPLEDDPTGDTLDALLCAIQAAWAWRAWPGLRTRLGEAHRLEGWIADPAVVVC